MADADWTGAPTGGRAARPQPRRAVQCGAEAPYPTSRPTRSGEEELHVARSTTTLARTSGHRRESWSNEPRATPPRQTWSAGWSGTALRLHTCLLYTSDAADE